MIRHIVALDRSLGIAKDGVQPWKLPLDEQYFSNMTKKYGGVILMGRTTFEVIGRPLPQRQNFVATRNSHWNAEGVTAVHDIDAFLSQHQDVWVIGGAELYSATMTRVDELYITEIEHDFKCDRFYPEYKDDFAEVLVSQAVTEGDLSFRFKLYKPS